MDLASLLHDSPSDDLRRRQSRQDPPPDAHAQQLQQQQPSQRPPHHSPPLDRPRDQLRERERAPQDLQHPSHGHVQHPPAYRRSPPPHHTSRPPSPPRHAPQYRAPSAGADFPAHSSQRHQLPPPSSLLSDPMYDVGGHASRRQEGLPHPHDRLGPSPGHPSSSVQVQPFTLEHRTTPSLPPKPQHHHHPHSHPSHHHALSHPNTPSATYIGPPSSRSIHASPPHSHHSSHGPGQGSIPLFPTAVGPGVPPSGPPAHAPPGPPPGGMSLRISAFPPQSPSR
ncbi:hypothetical protein BD310DRAFT_327991 [Dichomitus squalens]|uniref:Uncharacterized protein n=1 Tax=Dichomitus squalens TaxID=114155 RepID=A0A4Q9PF72_9APHY|nr:hypothetical protein BD310DRAFT_327991 [Dichomitus squalens]